MPMKHWPLSSMIFPAVNLHLSSGISQLATFDYQRQLTWRIIWVSSSVSWVLTQSSMDPLIRGLWLTPGLLTTNVTNDQSHDHPSNWWSPIKNIKIVKLPITYQIFMDFPNKKYENLHFFSAKRCSLNFPEAPRLHDAKNPARDLLGFCPVTKRRPLGTCPGSQTCWSLPGHKKSRGKQIGKAKLSSDRKQKTMGNQKSRRSMIYKWSMFTHFPELCHKMSQILEFNGWLTPLEWSINGTFMWKNLSPSRPTSILRDPCSPSKLML